LPSIQLSVWAGEDIRFSIFLNIFLFEKADSMLLHRRDTEILTYLLNQMILDLAVSRDRRTAILGRIQPPRMTTTFSHKDIPVLPQMLEKVVSLHTVRSSSV
jgi:hypothetical protein